MTRTPRPTADTWDCLGCYEDTGIGETYWTTWPGPHRCHICGGPLSMRRAGAEPFEAGSYDKQGQAGQAGTMPLWAELA